MADDWKPGDLALCVDDSDHPDDVQTGWNAIKGAIYTVSAVEIWPCGTYLHLAEDPVPYDDSAWDAIRFRKIHPLTDEEREGFLADLKLPALLVEA